MNIWENAKRTILQNIYQVILFFIVLKNQVLCFAAGRKKRKKRSAELVRRKRSNTVDITAYWNSSLPTCIGI